MIYMEPHHWNIVEEVLAKYPYTFYAFDSRTKGTQKHLSPLDLCYKDSIPFNIREYITEDFEESDLPFKVDVLDWRYISPEFRKIIEKDLVLIKKGTENAH